MAFIDIRLPNRICEQFSGTPTFATSMSRSRSGFSKANVDRPDVIFTYEASNFLKNFELRLMLMSFFMALKGMGHTFRFRDLGHYWTGCAKYGGLGDIAPIAAADMPVMATGDGAATHFQMYVPYAFGAFVTLRKITKPAKIDATDNPGYTGPRFYVESAASSGVWNLAAGWTLDYATGIVNLATPPANGATIKAAFLFDVHARWMDDKATIALIDSPEPGQVSIQITEEL